MFDYMDYIYEVYRERSFSKAAARLFISQSSLSSTVKRAEARIGLPIFDRHTYPIRLTEFGEQYMRAVEQIRTLRHNLSDYVYDTNHLQVGHLAVGAGNFLATYLAAPAIMAFKREHPNIAMQLLEGRTIDLTEQLINGSMDLLITNGQLDEEVCNKTVLFEEHLLLAVSKSFVLNAAGRSLRPPRCRRSLIAFGDLGSDILGKKPGVDLKAFQDVPFIGMRPGNDTRIRTDAMLADANCQFERALELDQSSTSFRLVLNGMGACVVSDTVVRRLGANADVCLYKIGHEQARRLVCVWTRKVAYTTCAIDEFVRILQTMRR